jgi:hypothetical protein
LPVEKTKAGTATTSSMVAVKLKDEIETELVFKKHTA